MQTKDSSCSDRARARPSERIKQATVTLLGLSYGEYDAGALRKEQSAIIAEVVHLWTSGLLAADYGQSEVHAVTSEFDHFMHSDPAPDLIEWTAMPISTLDQLITTHCILASQILTDLSVADNPPPSERLPPRRAARALTIVRLLLDRVVSFVDGTVVPVVSTDALSHFLYSASRLRASVSEFSELDSALCQNLSYIITHFCNLYQQQSEASLIVYVLPSVISITGSAVRVDAELSTPQHTLQSLMLAPALSSLAATLRPVGDLNRLNSVITTVVDILLETVDHVHTGSRVATLDILLYLNSKSPNSFSVRAVQLSERLPSAMLWKDPASTTRATSLLHALLPNLLSGDTPPPISQELPRIWQTAASTMMKTIAFHVDTTFTGSHDEDSDSDSTADHAVAAALIAPLLVQTLRHRLLISAGVFFTQMTKLLPRMVSLVASQRVAACHLASVSAAIEDGICHGWPRVSAHRARLFAACIEAVLEARYANESVKVSAQTAALTVVSALASANATEVMSLVEKSKQVAQRYPSLAQAVDLLRDAEVIVQELVLSSIDNDTVESFGKECSYGPLVKQFFGKIA